MLNNVKKLIKNNDITKAIKLLELETPDHLENEFITIVNSYKHWKQKELLGLGEYPDIRKKNIYALLQLISKIELEQVSGLQKNYKNLIHDFERNLSRGYKLLSDLKHTDIPINELLTQIHQYADTTNNNKTVNFQNKSPLSREEYEKQIRILVIKHEKIYKLLKINILLMIVIIILWPFLFTEDNLFLEILKNTDAGQNDNETDDDIDSDVD